MAMGRDATIYSQPTSLAIFALIPPKMPMFIRIKKDTMKPYRPWVPGSSSSTSSLPNLEGSSASTPMPASADIPTPRIEPIPANTVAIAALISAKMVPRLIVLFPP